MKMKPDRTNYEIWIIDYLDGNLTQDQIFALYDFLKENRDIKDEFTDLYAFYNKISEGSYKYKSKLKKSASDISESQFELLCVAASENDLDEMQQEEFNEIINEDPSRKKTYELFKNLKLKPPKAEFRHKKSLKKVTLRQKVYLYSSIVMGAAATILLLFYLLGPPAAKTPDNQIAAAQEDTVKTAPAFFITRVPPIKAPEVREINTEPKSLPSPQQKVRKTEIVAVAQNTAINDNIVESDSNSIDIIKRELNISKITGLNDILVNEPELNASLVAINTTFNNSEMMENEGRFNRFIARVVRKNILKSDTTIQGNLKVYEIADAGIKGLNKLLGWQMSLEKEKNDKGEVESVYFSSRLLKFNAPVRKVEPVL